MNVAIDLNRHAFVAAVRLAEWPSQTPVSV